MTVHARPGLDALDLLREGGVDEPEVDEQRRDEGDHDQEGDQRQPEDGEPVAAEPDPGVGPEPDLLLRDLPVDRRRLDCRDRAAI